ncbi:hypothetical protein PLESTB_000624100 [Pleodorina starrii]|uniref:PUM-HD domain-containing protein n=1 Tax=Pleodorina starrii TaxID=330485 RepID=A0A9W6F109_9CHLO|nr:hypothetical protein PLESTB_000624100 [Pleodorina starrii]
MLKAIADNGAFGGVLMAPPSQPSPSLPLGPTASHPAATMAAAPSPFHGAAVPLAAAAAALLPPTQFQRYYERMIEAHGEVIAELAAATSGGGAGDDNSVRCSEWGSGVPAEQCWTPLDELMRQRGLPEIEATEALVPASNLAAPPPPQPYYNHVGQYPQPGAASLPLLPPSAAAFRHLVSFDGRKAQPSCGWAAPAPGSAPPMSRLPLRRPPSPLGDSGGSGGGVDLRPAGRMLAHCFSQRAAGGNCGNSAGGASSAGPSAFMPPSVPLMDNNNGPADCAVTTNGGAPISAAGLYGFEACPLDPTPILPFCPSQGQDGVCDGQFGSLPFLFGDMSGAMPQFDGMELPHGALPPYQPVPSSNPPTPPMCGGNNAGERGGRRGVRGVIGGNGGGASMRLETLFGKLVAISCDKQGSRLIQALLSSATTEQMGRCVEELLEGIMEVACHPYGNFVVQQLMTVCGFRHKLRLCGAMAGHILGLSLDPYGCRIVQKLLEVVPEQQAAAAVAEFDGHVLRCMRDKYAHHVLCSALYHVPHHSQAFLVDALQASLPSLARHPYGCRLAQSLLQTVSEVNRMRAITWDLLQDAPQLGGHEYGNYVMQMLAQVGAPAVRSALTAALAPHALRLACCRHGSHVLQAVLKYGNDVDREVLLHALLLECCNSGQQARLAMALYPVIPDLTSRCAANQHPGMEALLARFKERACAANANADAIVAAAAVAASSHSVAAAARALSLE